MSENSEGKAWYDTPEEREKEFSQLLWDAINAHYSRKKTRNELDEKYRLLEEKTEEEKDP